MKIITERHKQPTTEINSTGCPPNSHLVLLVHTPLTRQNPILEQAGGCDFWLLAEELWKLRAAAWALVSSVLLFNSVSHGSTAAAGGVHWPTAWRNYKRCPLPQEKKHARCGNKWSISSFTDFMSQIFSSITTETFYKRETSITNITKQGFLFFFFISFFLFKENL